MFDEDADLLNGSDAYHDPEDSDGAESKIEPPSGNSPDAEDGNSNVNMDMPVETSPGAECQ